MAGFVVRLPNRLPIRGAIRPRGPGHQGVDSPADLRPVALHHLRVDAQQRVGLLVATWSMSHGIGAGGSASSHREQ